MQQNASVITGANGMEKIKHVSPECITHRHYDCPINKTTIKCQCLCHKLIGE